MVMEVGVIGLHTSAKLRIMGEGITEEDIVSAETVHVPQ